jgi:hypothetical protein
VVDPNSRYAQLPTLVYHGAQGQPAVYRARRLLPQGERMKIRAEVAVREGERLDIFTFRTLGPPEQFWRIADANDALDPFALVAEPGRLLAVPVPRPDGPVPSLEK